MRHGRGRAGIEELAGRAELVGDELLREAESEVTPADPMVVVYSSGSTSDPKGAIHSQGAVVRHAHNLWQFRDFTADDVTYTPMPLLLGRRPELALVAALHAGAGLAFDEQFEPGTTPGTVASRPGSTPAPRRAACGMGDRVSRGSRWLAQGSW